MGNAQRNHHFSNKHDRPITRDNRCLPLFLVQRNFVRVSNRDAPLNLHTNMQGSKLLRQLLSESQNLSSIWLHFLKFHCGVILASLFSVCPCILGQGLHRYMLSSWSGHPILIHKVGMVSNQNCNLTASSTDNGVLSEMSRVNVLYQDLSDFVRNGLHCSFPCPFLTKSDKFKCKMLTLLISDKTPLSV